MNINRRNQTYSLLGEKKLRICEQKHEQIQSQTRIFLCI